MSAAAQRVAVPAVPAMGLSVATGGAFALGAVGVLTAGVGGWTTCVFATATGVPCPFCGMTHGVAALGAGNIETALSLNPLAPLAVGLAVAVPVTLLRGRRLAVPAAALWALVAVIVLTWLVRVAS